VREGERVSEGGRDGRERERVREEDMEGRGREGEERGGSKCSLSHEAKHQHHIAIVRWQGSKQKCFPIFFQ